MQLPIVVKYRSDEFGDVQFPAITQLSFTEDILDPLTRASITFAPPPNEIDVYREALQKGNAIELWFGSAMQSVLLIETVTTTISFRGGFIIDVDAVHPIKLLQEGRMDVTYAKKFQTPTYTLKQLIIDVVKMFFWGLRKTSDTDGTVNPYEFQSVPIFESDDSDETDRPIGSYYRSGTPRTEWETVKVSEAQAQYNESAFSFIARQCTRNGLLLRPAPSGAVMLTKPVESGASVWTIGQSNSTELTAYIIDSLTETATNADQYSSYTVKGSSTKKSGVPATVQPEAKLEASMDDVESPPAEEETAAILAQPTVVVTGFTKNLFYTESSIPQRSRYRPGTWYPYKPFFIQDKQSNTPERALNTAKLAQALRAKDAYKISCRVDGVADDAENVFVVNRLCDLIVDRLDINEQFLITKRVVQVSKNAGQVVELEMVPRGALVIGEVTE